METALAPEWQRESAGTRVPRAPPPGDLWRHRTGEDSFKAPPRQDWNFPTLAAENVTSPKPQPNLRQRPKSGETEVQGKPNPDVKTESSSWAPRSSAWAARSVEVTTSAAPFPVAVKPQPLVPDKRDLERMRALIPAVPKQVGAHKQTRKNPKQKPLVADTSKLFGFKNKEVPFVLASTAPKLKTPKSATPTLTLSRPRADAAPGFTSLSLRVSVCSVDQTSEGTDDAPSDSSEEVGSPLTHDSSVASNEELIFLRKLGWTSDSEENGDEGCLTQEEIRSFQDLRERRRSKPIPPPTLGPFLLSVPAGLDSDSSDDDH